jgi:hypothetical protein
MRLIPNSFPNQYNAVERGNHCANIFQHTSNHGRPAIAANDRWYHDQGTCPDDGYATKEDALAAVDPAWRYVGTCPAVRHSSTF